MKRRNFLQAAAALSVPAFVPLTGVRANNASPFTSLIAPDSDRVLVIVHLFGGNDGLNTVLPIDQMDDLAKLRGQFHIRQPDIIKLNDNIGLHPSMGGMRNMFTEGRLKIVQSVGYPNQNRSHFRSTDIWTSGSDADELVRSGWMGRYLDDLNPGFPEGYPSNAQPDPPAISIGNVAHPACEGGKINFSQTVNNPNSIEELRSGARGKAPDDKYGSELDFVRTTMRQTNSYNSVIQKAYQKGDNVASYPSNNVLANQLKKVARLINGGLQTKVYTVYMSGFDTHANQVENSNPKHGIHAELLDKVSTAITAFQQDLVAQGQDERVMGMTFSEFGRRIKPNASLGTDHGTAGPMFLFGSCVDGGVLGDNVNLDAKIDQSEGVPMQFDFRDIYGSILADWFDVPGFDIQRLLHDDFRYVPLAGKCGRGESTNNNDTSADGWTIGDPYPDPNGSIRIKLNSPGSNRLRYTLFDPRGRMVLANEIGVEGQGDHALFNRPSRLPAGTYLLRLATDTGGTVSRNVVFN